MATRLTTGTEVTDKDGRRGIITDSYVKRAGQYKGMLELVWIGARYGVSSAFPEDLTEVPAKTAGAPEQPTALNIPETIAVVIESYPMFGEGTLRIEARQSTGTGQFEDFGEVAYWHTDGSNDIMKGETGTLEQAIQALVDFTLS